MRCEFAERLLLFGQKQHEFVEMLDELAPSLCELRHARREFAAMLSEFAEHRSVDRARR